MQISHSTRFRPTRPDAAATFHPQDKLPPAHFITVYNFGRKLFFLDDKSQVGAAGVLFTANREKKKTPKNLTLIKEIRSQCEEINIPHSRILPLQAASRVAFNVDGALKQVVSWTD